MTLDTSFNYQIYTSDNTPNGYPYYLKSAGLWNQVITTQAPDAGDTSLDFYFNGPFTKGSITYYVIMTGDGASWMAALFNVNSNAYDNGTNVNLYNNQIDSDWFILNDDESIELVNVHPNNEDPSASGLYLSINSGGKEGKLTINKTPQKWKFSKTVKSILGWEKLPK